MENEDIIEVEPVENDDFIEIDPADMEEQPIDDSAFLDGLEGVPQKTAEEKAHAEYLETMQEAEMLIQEQSFIQDVMYEYNISEEEAVQTLNEIKQKEEQDKQQEAEATDFLNAFKEINGREWKPGSDDIPEEVWKIQLKSNKPLKEAYREYKQDESFLAGFDSDY